MKRINAAFRAMSMIMLVTLIAVGTSCDKADEEPAHGQQARGARGKPDGKPGGKPGPDGQNAAQQQQAVPVAVSAVGAGSIASYYQATATLEAEKEAQVLARISGIVASISAEEGDRMSTGTTLLRVENGEYRLRSEQAKAKTLDLKSRFDRIEVMHAEGGISEEEFQAARSDLAIAEADEGLAELNLSYTTVRAPFAGRVTERLVDIGQNITIGTPLFVMADFDPLLARVHVPSREFNKLTQEQRVDLVLDSSGERLSGRIKLISPVIDPSSGTIKITIEIPQYPAGTRPGDFADVQIVTEKHDDTILVPRAAVVSDKGETLVFVAISGDSNADGKQFTAERRIVELGFADEESAEILSGLDVGEKIVVKGQRSLKHGAPLKILEELTPESGI